uniref:E2 binding domain-containing protein n=1 Tax=Alexandrium andersonii TaxID=327968 RepID=A0A7S2H6I4_9DINO|mmetsp:Transcript_68086/g.152564  ORF Transcript_68086/g.152564 Transcript_68086/m.152564 type:complete len:124 (+) Transcript_68086:3-374(+)
MMYMGQTGVYTHTFLYEKKDDCMVCGGGLLTLKRPASSTLQQLLDSLGEHPSYQLKRPSISGTRGVVFVQNPKALREQHEYKLPQTLGQLVDGAEPVFDEGEELIVTDPTLPSKLRLKVILES